MTSSALDVLHRVFGYANFRGEQSAIVDHVSGGSDCHGPGRPYQSVGARSVALAELDKIRELAR